MAVKSILPALIWDFNSGATLTVLSFNIQHHNKQTGNSLRGISRVNDDRLLGWLISHQIGIVITLARP